jgi:hypothetical protein
VEQDSTANLGKMPAFYPGDILNDLKISSPIQKSKDGGAAR